MPLEDITNDILNKAKKEAEQISQESEKEIQKLENKKSKEVAEVLNLVGNKEKKKIIKIKEQGEFQKRLIIKNAVSQAKRETINNIFEIAQKRLSESSDENFIQLIKSILRQTPKIADAEIIVSQKKAKIILDIIKTKYFVIIIY